MMVARICSEPGVMTNSALHFTPLEMAWRAIEAARIMSSYDELVQLPIRPAAQKIIYKIFKRLHEIEVMRKTVVAGLDMAGN